jgi:hypothetical protein
MARVRVFAAVRTGDCIVERTLAWISRNRGSLSEHWV